MSIEMARAYHLLGSLLLGDRETVAVARMTPPLAEMLAGQHESEIAAQHHSAFALEAFPYAGVFTETEALIGGRIADRIAALMLLDHHHDLTTSESPDHVGHILRVCGGLLGGGDERGSAQLVRECLLPWIAPWSASALRQPGGFWPYVVELALSLVAEHPMNLGVEPPPLSEPFAPADSAGVTELARALTIPVVTGAFIARQDIRNIGRQTELPTGFGSRALMLTNLFRSAAQHDKGAELLSALARFFDDQAAEIDAIPAMAPGLPQDIASPWSARSRATANVLSSMNDELGAVLAAVVG